MLYKTMVLGLLQQQPLMHQKLRREKLLLGAMEFYAGELKALHEGWKLHLSETKPGSDESKIASEALEIALAELQDSLPSASSSEDEHRPALDDLMSFLRAHTPTE
jgi:hypothetical protein